MYPSACEAKLLTVLRVNSTAILYKVKGYLYPIIILGYMGPDIQKLVYGYTAFRTASLHWPV
jgi:hypothetical protein